MASSQDTVDGTPPAGSGAAEADVVERLRLFSKSEFVRGLPYWFVPFFIMGVAVYGGIGWNLLLSLTDYSGFATPSFAQLDLEMYAQAVADPVVYRTAKNTFVLLIAFTTVSLVLGLFLALLLDRDLRFKGKIQTVYLPAQTGESLR